MNLAPLRDRSFGIPRVLGVQGFKDESLESGLSFVSHVGRVASISIFKESYVSSLYGLEHLISLIEEYRDSGIDDRTLFPMLPSHLDEIVMLTQAVFKDANTFLGEENVVSMHLEASWFLLGHILVNLHHVNNVRLSFFDSRIDLLTCLLGQRGISWRLHPGHRFLNSISPNHLHGIANGIR